MNRYAFIILLIFSLFIGFVIYKSPVNNYPSNIKNNPMKAIQVGRNFSHYLFLGEKKTALGWSINPAKEIIEKSDFRKGRLSNVIHEFKSNDIPLSKIPHTVVLDENYDNPGSIMELLSFQKLNSYIVMTFAYKQDVDFGNYHNQKIVFNLVLRYIEPFDYGFINNIFRKIANLPFIETITGGISGRWVVSDFQYTCTYMDTVDETIKWLKSEEYAKAEKNNFYIESKPDPKKKNIDHKELYLRNDLEELYARNSFKEINMQGDLKDFLIDLWALDEIIKQNHDLELDEQLNKKATEAVKLILKGNTTDVVFNYLVKDFSFDNEDLNRIKDSYKKSLEEFIINHQKEN